MPKTAAAMTASAMSSTATALNLFCLAAATTAELPLPVDMAGEGIVVEVAAEPEPPAAPAAEEERLAIEFAELAPALGNVPLADSVAVRFEAIALRPERPESVSRFRRCRSARMSPACW